MTSLLFKELIVLLQQQFLKPMLKRNWCLSLFLLLSSITTWAITKVNATEMISYPGGRSFIFRVELTDKVPTPFSLDRPQDFLSPRAIERRRHQGIAIDSTDLPIAATYLHMINEHKELSIVGKSKWNNSVLVKTTQAKDADILQKYPFVKKITKVFSSPDSITRSQRINFKKDFNAWDTISHHNTHGVAQEQIAALGGIKLHNAGYMGKGKVIAVLDAGFMNADRIPSLQRIKRIGIADFVVPPSKSIFLESDHGTMVLSTMATNLQGFYIGTAPEAAYVLVRCEDRQTEFPVEEDYWAEAVEYADSIGADIINSSLGYHNFDHREDNHHYFELDGKTVLISRIASLLASKGMVLVNSAGNDGMGTWKKINFPADAFDMLTVGAITPQGFNAPFSGIGPTQDGRIKPDVMAYGSPTAVISGRGTIVDEMGTSFSAPLVAGLVACLWQALPHKTAKEIINLVRQSGSNFNTPDNIYGYGVPNFYKALERGRK